MKKRLALLCFLSACANMEAPPFKSLIQEQPRVLDITPLDGSQFLDPVNIELRFSQRIDIHSLSAKAASLVQGRVDPSLLLDVADFIKEVESTELATVPASLTLNGNETLLRITPQQPLAPGLYQIVVTPALRSIDQVPFNQSPGEKPTPYVATFSYGEGFDASASLPPGTEDPETAPPSFGPPPSSLVIHEILYDGKVSETDGEAFVELYGTPGADISLYKVSWINGADGEETDRVTLPPGTNIPADGIFVIADLKTNSTSTTNVAEADFLDQFDPQNGPDAIQLFNREGELIDAIGYGNGALEISPSGFPLWEGTPAADVGGGHSLSRMLGEDTGDNSKDFVDLSLPTPGTM